MVSGGWRVTMDCLLAGVTGWECRMAYSGPSLSLEGLTSIEGCSSSICMLVSAAEGMVVRNLTVSLPGEPGRSASSCMALCLVNLGFALILLGSLEALDRDIRQVLVLAVVAEPDESFLELDKLESCEVFLVTSQEEARRLGSSSLSGIPQWWLWRQESDRDELKFSLDETEEALLCCFC
jgi:hypothetical protein